MPAINNTTIVLVHGAWHSGKVYERTEHFLKRRGVQSISLDLPSSGDTTGQVTFGNDVAHIRATLQRLITDERRNVVLVGHSVHGITVCEAAYGFGTASQQSERTFGGITRLVLIMALAMPPGFMCFPKGLEETQSEDWMDFDATTNTFTVSIENAKRIFYNDLPDEEATRWARQLSAQSANIFTTPSTHAEWRVIPTTFVRASEDKSSITGELVDYMVSQPLSNAIDTVEICTAGHCPMLSQPEWLADVLVKAARNGS